ncbi:MAG TPA: hypothetical protein PKI61_02320 [bacterium]|nr:hypothetical protein [bacterium]HPT29999.1 hypothetical protein [bacterium]
MNQGETNRNKNFGEILQQIRLMGNGIKGMPPTIKSDARRGRIEFVHSAYARNAQEKLAPKFPNLIFLLSKREQELYVIFDSDDQAVVRKLYQQRLGVITKLTKIPIMPDDKVFNTCSIKMKNDQLPRKLLLVNIFLSHPQSQKS